MRIAITSDVHYHPPWRDRITRLATILREQKPDLLILAGDTGEPLDLFAEGLKVFSDVCNHRAVIAGNHDVWHRTSTHTSQSLWEEMLPKTAFENGYHWLEHHNLVFGSVGICGTLAWYDYSGRDSRLDLTEDSYQQIKSSISNDARFIDWRWTDREFAGILATEFGQRIRLLQQNDEITDIVVVTHVPLFRESLKVYDEAERAVANAYYANLPLGNMILKHDKLQAVFSGHVHRDHQYTVERQKGEPLPVFNVPSDYGVPAALIWNTETQKVMTFKGVEAQP